MENCKLSYRNICFMLNVNVSTNMEKRYAYDIEIRRNRKKILQTL